MLMPHPSDNSLLNCPLGYQYYNCAVTRFVGCCSVEPCSLSGACPVQNQPGFQTLPDSMSSIISSAVPGSTPLSGTTTAIVTEMVTPEPAIATTIGASFSMQPQPYSTLSTLDTPTDANVNHTGLIAGLVVGLSVVLVVTAVLLCKLWRHRQVTNVGEDDVPSTLLRNLRTKAASGAAATGQSDRNKPVPPVPTSLTEAQLLDRHGEDDGRCPTGPNTPASTAGASTVRQPSIRAVPFSPSRPGAASISSRKDEGEGKRAAGTSTPSRAASPGASFFDSSPGRRDSGLDTTWVSSQPEYAELRSPSEFHGLSAPPRSRDGPRPGSKGNQVG